MTTPNDGNSRQQILDSLAPLFEKAEREGLWFESHYQQCQFTPKELRKVQSEGRFIWGHVNWKLIDPIKELRDPEAAAQEARKHNESIRARMGA